ncbi:MAG: alpha/beta fold hydrolase [Acidimicrobiales bacterium]
MTRPTFVWAHDLLSCVEHEDTIRWFNWERPADLSQLVRYDARGHGRGMVQYVDRAYRWSAMVDDMLRLADGPFVAGGIGMGAATALHAAITAPRRLAGLVLVAPPAAWTCRDDRAAVYQALASDADVRGATAVSEAWPVSGQPSFLRESFDGPAELLTRHLFGMDPRAIPCILRGAALSDLASQDLVHNVIVPTLILGWSGDPGHPLAVAEQLSCLMIQNVMHVAHDLNDMHKWPDFVGDFLTSI